MFGTSYRHPGYSQSKFSGLLHTIRPTYLTTLLTSYEQDVGMDYNLARNNLTETWPYYHSLTVPTHQNEIQVHARRYGTELSEILRARGVRLTRNWKVGRLPGVSPDSLVKPQPTTPAPADSPPQPPLSTLPATVLLYLLGLLGNIHGPKPLLPSSNTLVVIIGPAATEPLPSTFSKSRAS